MLRRLLARDLRRPACRACALIFSRGLVDDELADDLADVRDRRGVGTFLSDNSLAMSYSVLLMLSYYVRKCSTPYEYPRAGDVELTIDRRWRHRHRASASASATSGPCATSTSTSPRARCSACSGHNGAGKTTAIRILTTLSANRPRAGHGRRVRRRRARPPPCAAASASPSQQATVDGLMSARLNLEMVGRLHTCRKAAARRRGRRAARAARPRRRRDRAGEDLLGRHAPPARPRRQPRRPTRGAVPRRAHHRSRPAQPQRPVGHARATSCATAPRSSSRRSTSKRPTAWPTTSSCSTTAATVAHGTPDELKARIGDDRIDVKVAASQRARRRGQRAVGLRRRTTRRSTSDCSIVTAPVSDGARLIDVVRALDDAGIDAVDLNRREATLDDVFLTLTGAARPDEPDRTPSRRPQRGARMSRHLLTRHARRSPAATSSTSARSPRSCSTSRSSR